MCRRASGAADRRWRGTRRVSLVIGGLIALLPPAARADLGSHFGISPRSMGLGGAYTAVAEDVAALYYNPAGLVQMQGMTVAAGFLFGAPALEEGSESVEMPTERSWYLTVGVPLTGRLKDHLGFGFSLNVPLGKLFRARLYRKEDPYFVLYDSAVELLHLQLGGALRIPYKPLSFLSFGASMHVLASAYASVGFFAPFQRGGESSAADPDQRLEAYLDLDVPTEAFATVGMMVDVGQRWRIGLSYRGSRFIAIDLPISFKTRLALAGASDINLPVDAVASMRAKYWPQQVNLGVSFRSERWLLTMDLAWVDYSAYQIPYARIDLDVAQLTRDPGVRIFLGPDAVMLDPIEPDVRFEDRIVPRFGVEHRVISWLTLRGGYYFERSPLQTTNLPVLDTDKHSWALSGRASFLKPLGLLPGWLHLDLTLQQVVFVSRSVLGADVGGYVFGLFTGAEVVLL